MTETAHRAVARLFPAQAMGEGRGVTVHRSVGLPGLSVVDPFLLLDEFVIGGDAEGAGFPDHPHRGFETVTYMLSGRMEHRDNAGHAGVIGPGDAQWMTAGRGIVHSEMPRSDGEEIRGLQLWVNLAAAEKMKPPHYQDIAADAFPVVEAGDGAAVTVIAGRFGDATGPVEGIALAPTYLDVALDAGATIDVPIEPGHAAMVYVLDGAMTVAGESAPAHHLAILGDGAVVTLAATDASVRAVVIAARPLGEPVARHGPFVMNTRAEINQAVKDYTEGRM